jgi:AsmA protein
MSSPVKICLYFVAFVTILAVALTVLVKTQVTPEKVKKTLLPLIEKKLDRNVDFGEVNIGLFTGISVADITVMQQEGKEDFFSIKSVELHYQLWQLLLGKVIVDQIYLNHPVIHCERRSDGQFNFSDLFQESPADKNHNATSATGNAPVVLTTPFNLLIKEVNIVDGQVLFVDKNKNPRSPFRYTLNNLSIKARQIAFDKSFPIDLSAVVNGSNIDISGNYNLSKQSGDLTIHLAPLDLLQFAPYYRATLPGKLGSALLALNLEVDFQPQLISSKGTVSFDDVDLVLEDFPQAPLVKAKITTEYALSYKLDKQLLDMSTLLLNFNGINLGAEGKLDLTKADPFLVFTLLFKQFDLREAMQSLPPELSKDYRKYSFAGLVDGRVDLTGKLSSGLDLLKSVNLSLSDVRASAENLRAGISGDISYEDRILRSENLLLQYGDQQAMLEVKAEKSSEGVFRGTFSLSADTLNINKILPEQTEKNPEDSDRKDSVVQFQGQNTQSSDIGPFNLPLDMTGRMAINRLIYNNLNINKVSADLSVKNNFLLVQNLSSQIGGGELRGNTIVNLGVRGLTYQGELALAQSNVMPLVAGLFPQFSQTVSGTLQSQSRFSGHGTSPTNFMRDLHLNGTFGLKNGEVRGSSLLEGFASFLGASDLKALSFQSLNGEYDLQDGLAQISGQLDSSKIKLTPAGTIDIAGRLNLHLGASFAPETLNKLGVNEKLKETISGGDGWGKLPLQIKGKLDNPQFSYDSTALQKQIVDQASQKLMEKVSPDDSGDQEPIRQMLDNTLDKLFGN